jgi:hypothetical protein
MDAIAFLMSAETAVMPSARGEAPLPEAPFGVLAAAAADSQEEEVGNTDDASDAAPQEGLIAATVSQWLAQRNSLPSLPTFAPGIRDVHPSAVPETALPPEAAGEPALPIEDLPSIEVSDHVPEVVEPAARSSGTLGAAADLDAKASGNASPEQGPTPAAPRAHNGDSRVPVQQLMVHAADMGWNEASSEARPASADLKMSVPSEPVEIALARPHAPAPEARVNVTLGQQAIEPPADRPAKSATAPETPVRDEANELNAVAPRGTTTTDRPNISEQPGSAHVSTRTPETAQPSPNASSNTANAPVPAADNVSITPAPNNTSAVEHNAEMPVRLALATREGQTAEMQTLALHIAARWARGESRFTIRLDPPELGRIDVNLNVSNHGHAQAVLAVEKPQTLDLLLRDAPTLERALKDAGLELGGNLSFSLKEDARQNFAHQYSPPSRTIELVTADAAKPHVALNASLVEQLYGSHTARLDITV